MLTLPLLSLKDFHILNINCQSPGSKDTGKVIYIATKVKFCKRVVAFVKKENCTTLEKFTNLLSGNIQDIIIFYVKMAAWQRFIL